ncbi:hypothetical protein U1Q18_031449 [Sarracenia purpurea var. burkii]
MEHKRSPISVDQGSLASFVPKRPKADLSISSKVSCSLASFVPKRPKADLSISSKDSKEKLGEKIAALQQLVSPYGKTDTASVLLEAMEYIRFLHEQVKVLSAPYLQSNPTAKMQCQFRVLSESLAATAQTSGHPSRPVPPNFRGVSLHESSMQSMVNREKELLESVDMVSWSNLVVAGNLQQWSGKIDSIDRV